MNEGWNDSLFKFFRSRLNDSKNFLQEWTTPPDHVFDQALKEVAMERRRRRRRRFIPWFLALGVLLLMSGSYFVLTNLNGTKQKVDELEERVQNLESTTEMATFEDADEFSESLTEHEKSAPSANHVTSHKQIASRADKRSGFQDSNERQLVGPSISGDLVQNEQFALEKVQAKPLVQAGSTTRMASDDLALIGRRKISPFIQNALAIRSIVAVAAVSNIDGRQKGRYFVALSAGHNFSSFSMTNTGGGDATLSRYDRYYSGAGLNVSLEYMLGDRWSVTGAGAYSQLKNRSLFIDQLVYNTNNEHSDPAGNSIYETELRLETPLGSFQRSAEVSMSDLKMSDGDLITNSTAISQDLEVASVQVGIRYSLIRAARWQAFSGIGAGLDLIVRSDSDMHSAISMKDHVKKEMNSSTSKLDYLQKRYATAHLEAGLKYQLRNRVNVLVDTKFHRSLTSLRDPGGDLGPKTFLQQFSTAIGIELEF